MFEALDGVEGPEGYLLPDGETWCVVADRFAAGKGYLPMVSKDLSSGRFRILEPEEYDMGRNKKRHGGILQITDEEYYRLLSWFGGKNPVIEGLYADPDLYYEDGTYYIYPTTDGFRNWSGNEFYVFASRQGGIFLTPAEMGLALRKRQESLMWHRMTFPGQREAHGRPASPKEGIITIFIFVQKTKAGNPVSEQP